MPDDTQCPLRIKWPNRGADQCPRVILSFSIDSAYLTSADAFSVELYDDNPARLRDLLFEPVELSVDGATQLIGRVEQVRRGYGGPFVAELRGRDYIADLVEGNVDPTLQVSKDMTLVAALKLAMSPYGVTSVVSDADVVMQNVLTGINVKTRKKPKKSLEALKLEEIKPEFGQGCFDWCNKLVSRNRLTIQPSTIRSEVRLAEPTYDQDPVGKLWRTAGDNPRGNVLDGECTQDGSRTPTYVVAKGEQGQSGKSAKPLAAECGIDRITAFKEVTAAGCVSSRRLPGKCGPLEFGKLYRLLTYEDKVAKTEEQLGGGLWRALGERIKDLLCWTGSVRGYRDELTRAIYAVDTVLDVQDDWADVHERMWTAQRRISWGNGQGSKTNMTCWRLGALML